MTRPHIEYLQSQALPWQPAHWPHLAGCQVKVLSRDPATGAASALVRFPAGWHSHGPGYLDADEELFVLEGALDIDGRRYPQDCYGGFPAGARRAAWSAPEGAVALVFYAAEPGWTAGEPPAPAAAATFHDAYEMPWSWDGMDPAYAGVGLRWKILRGSPHGTAATMLVTCPPHLHPPRWVGPQEVHDCAEEMYLLSGDFLSALGPMAAGAYFWRPPGVAHGPYGSRGGSLALIRTDGAPLVNHWTSHEVELGRSREYRPVLPAELAGLRAHPWRPQPY